MREFRGLITSILTGLAMAFGPRAQADDYDRFFAAQIRRLDAPNLTGDARARIVLDTVESLDRAANLATTVDDRRRHWEQAVAILDRFIELEADHPQRPRLEAQAGIYLAAIGHLDAQLHRAGASQDPARDRSTELLDRAIATLDRSIASLGRGDALRPTLAYHLALAHVDRAETEADPAALEARWRNALKTLGDLEPKDRRNPQVSLLRARIETRLGRLDDAETSLREARGAASAPASVDWLGAAIALDLARGQHDQALGRLDNVPAGSDDSDLLRLKIELDRRGHTEDPDVRRLAEERAFAVVRRLGEAGSARRGEALRALAAGIEEPQPETGADELGLLAEAYLATGEPETAARLTLRRAERLEVAGEAVRAARVRFEAAARLYSLGRLEDAGPALDRLVATESAGPLRSKAALLRALSRGERGLDTALAAVIARFPESPEADEARWLLGGRYRAQGEDARALKIWGAIGDAHPRSIDARLAMAEVRRDEVEAAASSHDAEAVDRSLRLAREELQRLQSASDLGDSARFEVELARAELESIPGAGDPAAALGRLDRLVESPLDVPRRSRARRLRIVALCAAGRYQEAERLAETLLPTLTDRERLRLAGRLDRLASTAESDLEARRAGSLCQMIAATVEDSGDGLARPEQDLAKLLRLRGEWFRGADDAAREGLDDWPEAEHELGPDLLPDLASLARGVGRPERAADLYRTLADREKAGTVGWFRARLGLAESLADQGRTDLARRLLDATETLHPDLGGPELRRSIESTRRQLDDQ